MAIRRKKTSAKKPEKITSLTNYDSAFAEQAEEAAGQEAHVSGGQFFSLSGATLKFDGSPIPGNHMSVVILDSVLANTYYAERYDADSPAAPDCYAFGRDPDEMAPHEDSASPCSDRCAGCDMNEFGSADQGRGKACANRRRLALIPAGMLAENGEYTPPEDGDLESAEVAYLAVPPTSTRGFAAFVKKLKSSLKRPPHGVVTKISVVPDTKSQLKVLFEVIEAVSGEDAGVVIERNRVERENTTFPYPKAEEKKEQKPKKRAGKKTGGRRKAGF